MEGATEIILLKRKRPGELFEILGTRIYIYIYIGIAIVSFSSTMIGTRES